MNKFKYQKYKGTFKCGHEGETTIGGYTEEYRDETAEKFFNGLCAKCLKKERAVLHKEVAKKAEKEAKQLNLPELEGSEKQIQWALTLRSNLISKPPLRANRINTISIIDYFTKGNLSFAGSHKEEYLQIIEGDNPYNKLKELMPRDIKQIIDSLLQARINLLESETSSTVYIDNRDLLEAKTITVEGLRLLSRYEEKTEQEKIAEQLKKEIEEEVTVIPEDYNGTICTIIAEENRIKFIAPKNEALIEIVKELGYRWNNKVWQYKITETSGSLKDRIAELGNHLLVDGYGVIISDPEARQMAIDGNYECKHERWVIEYNGQFKLYWEKNNNYLYSQAKKIRTARWHKSENHRNGIVISAGSWRELDDFATLNDFKFSDKATNLMVNQKEKGWNKVKITKGERIKYKDGNKALKSLLETPADVLEDLKED